ncbi:aminoglycoside phosphotransferase family protein [Arthrobacter sp. NEB 688]|uniref:aminoglycoside phosphotransferase family protein n=1 Tax=Arthrobacter sp. NEB 688 TaxID=904039 RepID=UPI00159B3766|nr:aminoglycoside phosphotransferase family protein [Arthrobacter sp. NEB 688]QKE83132.1 aminoglycoside phosphotransferase family protein [Arthrobacter sp. NEB 688]
MEITEALVRRLVDAQLPPWAGLPVRAVPRQGHDNRTFRLGDDLAVRLPSHERYVAGIAKEDAVLPHLAAHLPVAVPVPVATGRPGEGFPFPWSVRRWLEGETPDHVDALDRMLLAADLGTVLRRLREVPAAAGPPAGEHSFHRGGDLRVYAHEVEDVLAERPGDVDPATCRAVWQRATGSTWSADPVWVHGDVAVGNLLVHDGRLSALIDFGTCAVGDPACDLVVAWTLFDATERRVFREAVDLPDDVWERARGWALWKALVTDPDGPHHLVQQRALRELLDEVA